MADKVKAETVVRPVVPVVVPFPEKKSIVAPLEIPKDDVPEGFVRFEFNPETKDEWGREIERVSVAMGNWNRTFEKQFQPFLIPAQDWTGVQVHAPKIFREVSKGK